MDIAQAKQELRRTIRAYTAKTEDGVYRMPRRMQRPVLLMGPPGIGKTAILPQLAQEEHIGLAAYTMTHHTRQSALGLPVIVGRTAAGKTFRATEYTMSEIIASVYEQMEKTGLHEGILFLDEINCVSETLMPAILQMLQNKTFGVHSLPEGWLIVAAGNPPRYNQSARSFDMATLDRVRCIELEPSLAAWQPYAAAGGVHPAVLSYLRLHPEHFFLCSASAAAGEFATARGWEELSALLLAYEALGYPCTLAQMQQYLHAQEAAAGFAAFYELFRRYAAQLPLEEILTGTACPEAGALRELPFDGRLSVVEFLLHSLQTKSAAMHQDAPPAAFRAELAVPYENLLVYFLFRYALKAVNDRQLLPRVAACVFHLLCLRELLDDAGAETALCAAASLYSKEVEHSEENQKLLLKLFRRKTLTWQYLVSVLDA